MIYSTILMTIPKTIHRIDNIYIINLKERTDRWEHCLSQLKKYNITNYTRLDAIRPALKSMHPIQYSKNNLQLGNEYIIGAMGCKLSHLKAIAEAQKNNYEQILILEDDFLLANDFTKKFSAIADNINSNSVTIDMLYLGFSTVRENAYEDTDIDNLKKLTNGHTTHAYLLNRSFYSTIITEILHCYCEIDVCYVKMQQKHDIYGIHPCLVTQMESFSDILSKDVSYDEYIELDNK